MDEIEYLEEYADLILPSIKSVGSPENMPTGGTTTTSGRGSRGGGANAADEEYSSSSSIDQDIFDSLFDDQTGDTSQLLQQRHVDPKAIAMRNNRMNSLDLLVKDLVGDTSDLDGYGASTSGMKSHRRSPPKFPEKKSIKDPDAVAMPAPRPPKSANDHGGGHGDGHKSKSVATVRPTLQHHQQQQHHQSKYGNSSSQSFQRPSQGGSSNANKMLSKRPSNSGYWGSGHSGGSSGGNRLPSSSHKSSHAGGGGGSSAAGRGSNGRSSGGRRSPDSLHSNASSSSNRTPEHSARVSSSTHMHTPHPRGLTSAGGSLRSNPTIIKPEKPIVSSSEPIDDPLKLDHPVRREAVKKYPEKPRHHSQSMQQRAMHQQQRHHHHAGGQKAKIKKTVTFADMRNSVSPDARARAAKKDKIASETLPSRRDSWITDDSAPDDDDDESDDDDTYTRSDFDDNDRDDGLYDSDDDDKVPRHGPKSMQSGSFKRKEPVRVLSNTLIRARDDSPASGLSRSRERRTSPAPSAGRQSDSSSHELSPIKDSFAKPSGAPVMPLDRPSLALKTYSKPNNNNLSNSTSSAAGVTEKTADILGNNTVKVGGGGGQQQQQQLSPKETENSNSSNLPAKRQKQDGVEREPHSKTSRSHDSNNDDMKQPLAMKKPNANAASEWKQRDKERKKESTPILSRPAGRQVGTNNGGSEDEEVKKDEARKSKTGTLQQLDQQQQHKGEEKPVNATAMPTKTKSAEREICSPALAQLSASAAAAEKRYLAAKKAEKEAKAMPPPPARKRLGEETSTSTPPARKTTEERSDGQDPAITLKRFKTDHKQQRDRDSTPPSKATTTTSTVSGREASKPADNNNGNGPTPKRKGTDEMSTSSSSSSSSSSSQQRRVGRTLDSDDERKRRNNSNSSAGNTSHEAKSSNLKIGKDTNSTKSEEPGTPTTPPTAITTSPTAANTPSPTKAAVKNVVNSPLTLAEFMRTPNPVETLEKRKNAKHQHSPTKKSSDGAAAPAAENGSHEGKGKPKLVDRREGRGGEGEKSNAGAAKSSLSPAGYKKDTNESSATTTTKSLSSQATAPEKPSKEGNETKARKRKRELDRLIIDDNGRLNFSLPEFRSLPGKRLKLAAGEGKAAAVGSPLPSRGPAVVKDAAASTSLPDMGAELPEQKKTAPTILRRNRFRWEVSETATPPPPPFRSFNARGMKVPGKTAALLLKCREVRVQINRADVLKYYARHPKDRPDFLTPSLLTPQKKGKKLNAGPAMRVTPFPLRHRTPGDLNSSANSSLSSTPIGRAFAKAAAKQANNSSTPIQASRHADADKDKKSSPQTTSAMPNNNTTAGETSTSSSSNKNKQRTGILTIPLENRRLPLSGTTQEKSPGAMISGGAKEQSPTSGGDGTPTTTASGDQRKYAGKRNKSLINIKPISTAMINSSKGTPGGKATTGSEADEPTTATTASGGATTPTPASGVTTKTKSATPNAGVAAAATTAASERTLTTNTSSTPTTTSTLVRHPSSVVITGSTYNLQPLPIEPHGTHLYSFLHPTTYNDRHGRVMLDYCCPNLDKPMPAIDPSRLHARIDTEVRELPAYIVMTTKLVTRTELQANKNSIPASIRKKVDKITTANTTAGGGGGGGSGSKTAKLLTRTSTPAATTTTATADNRNIGAPIVVPEGSRTILRRFDGLCRRYTHLSNGYTAAQRLRVIEGVISGGNRCVSNTPAAPGTPANAPMHIQQITVASHVLTECIRHWELAAENGVPTSTTVGGTPLEAPSPHHIPVVDKDMNVLRWQLIRSPVAAATSAQGSSTASNTSPSSSLRTGVGKKSKGNGLRTRASPRQVTPVQAVAAAAPCDLVAEAEALTTTTTVYESTIVTKSNASGVIVATKCVESIGGVAGDSGSAATAADASSAAEESILPDLNIVPTIKQERPDETDFIGDK